MKYKYSSLLSVCMMTFLTGFYAPAHADDTEIYLGAAANAANIKNNILFILDTSFSMQAAVLVDKNNDGTLDPNDPDENLGSRISILKNAMDTLITGLPPTNVGYMRMNGTEAPGRGGASRTCNAAQIALGATQYYRNRISTTNTGGVSWGSKCYLPIGGHVMFPVTDIESPASDALTFSLVAPIKASADDAVQVGSTVIDDENLELGYQSCPTGAIQDLTARITSADNDADETSARVVRTTANRIELGQRSSGFRFQNIDIDPADSILSASIIFTSRARSIAPLDLEISGGRSADSSSTFATKNISSRGKTTATIDWVDVPETVNNQKLTTPDLSAVVREIIEEKTIGGTAAWTANDAMVFLLDGDPSIVEGRRIYNYRGDASKAAELRIKYCDESVRTSSVPPLATERTWIGLRFQDVGLPQGVEVTSATIDFTASYSGNNANNNGGPDDRIAILGEDTDDAAPFVTGTPFGTRTKVGRVLWTGTDMGTWVEGGTYTTPNLSDIVESIAERPGWCGGNDMAFFLRGGRNEIRRLAKSWDNDPANAPALRITYQPTYKVGATGCNIRSFEIPIIQSDHDAQTNSNTTMVTTLNNKLQLAATDNRTIGLIFKLPVKKDADIMDARLEFIANSNNASGVGISKMLIKAEVSDNAAVFENTDGNLSPSTRPRISTQIPWSQGPAAANATFASADVAPLISAVTSRVGWVKDNKMAFLIEDDPGGTAIRRQAKSFDDNPVNAPTLHITVKETRGIQTPKTVRERLLEINNTFNVSTLLGWTPSTETLYEASLYWRGKGVLFGKKRGLANLPNPTHGVDYTLKAERANTSHPGSYTGGTYKDDYDTTDARGGGTDCQFKNTRDCMHDVIEGSPTYISPLNTGLACAKNYQIFLTDGAPTSVAESTIRTIINDFADIGSCSVDPAVNASTQKGSCAVEMVKSLYDNDLNTTATGKQNVETYTIAFNLQSNTAKNWLKQLATAGGGEAYTANTTAQLLAVFNKILNTAIEKPTSFVSPAIAANSFNRLFSRDEVYFGMFQPKIDRRWDGNIKKYRVCTDTTTGCQLGDILQADGTLAVVKGSTDVKEEGLFKTDAVSIWSQRQSITPGDDVGREVSPNLLNNFAKVGGAGGALSDYRSRIIYTDKKDDGVGGDKQASRNESLHTNGFIFKHDTWNAAALRPTREAVCPTPETDVDDPNNKRQCIDYMLWVLGRDVLDKDKDGDTTDTRWSFNDVLHSSPVSVTYGKDTNDKFIDKILAGTNDGGLRFINGETGEEEWIFMPNILLKNQASLYKNGVGQHVYGLDASPVLRIKDKNNDGTIDPADGDFVHVYIGMRRGGNKMYALDISPPGRLTTNAKGNITPNITPKFLWMIDGDAPAPTIFDRLGQTWSDPVLSTIAVDNIPTDVLIFGGGYDGRLDTSYGANKFDPNKGNAIYIVNAGTGEKIMDISGDSPGITADILVRHMYHAIPSKLTVIDSDGDGLDDRIYVGDMGGNVWRVDLGGDIKVGNPGQSTVGRLASVTDNGINGDNRTNDGVYDEPATQRRFFVPPSVVQVANDKYSNVADYDYVLIPSGNRASPLETVVNNRFYAFRDRTIGKMARSNTGQARNYPRASGRPIRDDGIREMIDISNVVNSGAGLDSAVNAHKRALGWFLDLNKDGEKGLTTPVSVAGTVFFPTYIPEKAASSSDACDAREGSSRVFALDIVSAGSSSIDWDGDDVTQHDADDVVQELGAGIPSEAVPIFTPEGVTLLIGTGGGAQNLGKISDLPRFRTYWYKEES